VTAIFYPDCDATSSSGRFALEARSPHNRAIPHRDGRPATAKEFGFQYREHQASFRYRLLDLAAGGEARVVWERWQPKREDSPHEMAVSDDGWSILRTHGFRPEVVAVSPSGADVARVRVVGKDGEALGSPDADRTPGPAVPVFAWRAKHLAFTTAGCYWADHSWQYFLRHDGRDWFAWRARWGQRLVLDLTRAALATDDEQVDAPLAAAMADRERAEATALLAGLAARADEVQAVLAAACGPGRKDVERHPLRERIARAVAAAQLAGVHRVRACVPYLRTLEPIDYPNYSTGSSAMSQGWWLEIQHFRPVVHHALRLLGAVPQGYATYHFRKGDKERFPMPERIVGRRERAAELDRGMSPEQVLGLIGSPDHVRRKSHPVGTLFEWTEDWEYDFRVAGGWVTLRITWEAKGRKENGRIMDIGEQPAEWLTSDERGLQVISF
jgi:hypothetical protein